MRSVVKKGDKTDALDLVWHWGRSHWTGAEILEFLNESLGRFGCYFEDIAVPTATGPTF